MKNNSTMKKVRKIRINNQIVGVLTSDGARYVRCGKDGIPPPQ
jgi:hypothetical protein